VYCWMILVVVMLLPVDLTAVFTNADGYILDIGLRYGWGIFRYYRQHSADQSSVRAKVLGINVYRRHRPYPTDGEPGDATKGIMGIYARRDTIARALKAGKDIYRTSPSTGINATLRVGLDDPACTGFLAGFMASMCAVFGSRFNFEPDFSGPAFDVDAQFTGRLIPVMVALVLLKHIVIYFFEQISAMINQRGGRRHGYKREPEGNIR
jgi:hypothetical protein